MVFLITDLSVDGATAEWYGNHIGGPPEEDPASGTATGHELRESQENGARIETVLYRANEEEQRESNNKKLI